MSGPAISPWASTRSSRTLTFSSCALRNSLLRECGLGPVSTQLNSSMPTVAFGNVRSEASWRFIWMSCFSEPSSQP